MLHIFENTQILLQALADFFIQECKEAINRKGRCDVVLSGGSSPKKLYELLASKEYRDRIAWDKLFFFFGDERFVPRDDSQSNYRMVKEALFDPLHIAADHIKGIDTTSSPKYGAEMYEHTIRQHLGTSSAFDIILLGLGDNAHTASLFPFTSVLYEKDALVKEVFVEEVNQYRITLTAPVINRGGVIVFLVYGSAKASAIYKVLCGEYNPERYPAQLIKPTSGTLNWFIDKEAAIDVSKHQGFS